MNTIKSSKLEALSHKLKNNNKFEWNLKLNEKLILDIKSIGFGDEKELNVYLKGDNSEVEVTGRILLSRNQKADIKVNLFHIGKNTKGKVDIKVVLKDEAELHFEGLLNIGKKAFGANSYLSQKNLIIGDGVKVNSVPSLEIKNNNVKCSHGVTIGRVGEEEVYYMCSRGLSVVEAEEIIVEGFLL